MAKKNTENQMAELNIENMPKSVTDPETGLKVKVTKEMIMVLMNAERVITTNMEQLALALKTIRDDKLYLLYEIGSMGEYLEKRFSFSERFGYSLLKFADVFGDSKHFSEIMHQPRRLLELASKDDNLAKQLKDGEVTMPDGTRLSLKELKKEFANELVSELERTKSDLKATKKEARENKQLAEEQGKTLAHYEDSLAEGNFKKITKKKEVMAELFAIDAQAADMVKRLDSIESEEPEVVSQLVKTLTGVLAGFSQVQNKHMHLILSVTPDSKN